MYGLEVECLLWREIEIVVDGDGMVERKMGFEKGILYCRLELGVGLMRCLGRMGLLLLFSLVRTTTMRRSLRCDVLRKRLRMILTALDMVCLNLWDLAFLGVRQVMEKEVGRFERSKEMEMW